MRRPFWLLLLTFGIGGTAAAAVVWYGGLPRLLPHLLHARTAATRRDGGGISVTRGSRPAGTPIEHPAAPPSNPREISRSADLTPSGPRQDDPGSTVPSRRMKVPRRLAPTGGEEASPNTVTGAVDGQGPVGQIVVTGPILGETAPPASLDGDLRALAPALALPTRAAVRPEPKSPVERRTRLAAMIGADPVVQTWPGSVEMPATSLNFKGMQFSTSGAGWPPDTNGDVGPNHYIQLVNTSLQIFDKSGSSVYGPQALDTFFSSFTGSTEPCRTSNNGDPVVLYDRVSGHWIISDFAWTSNSGPFYECLAVSKTSDPVSGGWWLYTFQTHASYMADYPKLGVWADGIYMSANMFQFVGGVNPWTWRGAETWALNRADLISGATLHSVAFPVSNEFGLLPTNYLGALPPTGSPEIFTDVEYGLDVLHLWKFHVDWTTPANSTFSASPTTVPVAHFNVLNSTTWNAAIPQPGIPQRLDQIDDRLMMQAQYRRLGATESLWLNHSVANGGVEAVRWYEVRDPNGTPTVYQQGTYQPDTSAHRWMGALAVDGAGNMALGYSVSSGTVYPGIRYGGRLAADPLGQLPQGESSLITGTGSQTTYDRWGDYSSMSVDPADDCTFWYTTEYYQTTGTNWQTSIGAFSFPSCVSAPLIITQPSDQVVAVGQTASFTAAASGTPTPTVQWQVSTNGGGIWSDIGGADGTTYTHTALLSETGYQYHAVFTNGAGSATTNAATLTVNGAAPSVTQHPTSQTVAAGQSVSFTAAATGNPTPTVQWQVSINGGGVWSDIGGAAATTYTHTALLSENGYQYQAVFTNSADSATTNAATLTVNGGAPTVTLHPTDQTVAAGQPVSFTAAASGNPTPTVQWQVSTKGGAWNDIPGATATTYIHTALLSENGNQYHAVFTNSAGSATTNAAALTVNGAAPAVTQHPTSQAVTVGQAVSFSAAATGTPTPTVQWQVSINGGGTWSDIAGATATTYVHTALLSENEYQYRAVFTNASGSAATNAATLTVAQATVSLDNLTQVYDGTPKQVTFTTVPPGLAVVVTYDLSLAAPTNAGSYAVVATVQPPYSGTATGTLTITKATATVALQHLVQTYDGTPRSPSAVTTPSIPSATVAFTYNGSATTPTIAGSYSVVATVQDPNYQGTANALMTIMNRPVTLRPIDGNGDHAGDVFRYNATAGAWSLDISDRAGQFTSRTGTWSPDWKIYPADFNGDGLTDFLLYNVTAGTAYELVNTGADFVYSRADWSPGWDVTVLDFNGDGRSDLFLYNPTTGIWFRAINTGAGIDQFAYATGPAWSPEFIVRTGDFNGDGRSDLFLYHPVAGTWFEVLTTPALDFTYRGGTMSEGWTLTVADFDGDGRSDVFLYRPADGRWFEALSTGPGTFDWSRMGTWSEGFTISVGDFNGDGRADLFLYHPVVGTWWQALTAPDGTLTTWNGASMSEGWQVSVTDLDGDGRSDVVLYRPADGISFTAVSTGPGTFRWTGGTWGPGWGIFASR